MKVALAAPGDKYDPNDMKSWKLDIEKGFLQLDPVTVIQPQGFTPTIQGATTAGSPTYVTQQGEWAQIARRVFFSMYVRWSAVGGMAGNVEILGLPLPSRNVANHFNQHVTRWSGVTFPANFTACVAQQSPGANKLQVIALPSAGGLATNLQASTLAAAGDFIITGNYPI